MSPEDVVDATTLAQFIHEQVEQLRVSSQRWENTTVEAFLLGGAAWLEDAPT